MTGHIDKINHPFRKVVSMQNRLASKSVIPMLDSAKVCLQPFDQRPYVRCSLAGPIDILEREWRSHSATHASNQTTYLGVGIHTKLFNPRTPESVVASLESRWTRTPPYTNHTPVSLSV